VVRISTAANAAQSTVRRPSRLRELDRAGRSAVQAAVVDSQAELRQCEGNAHRPPMMPRRSGRTNCTAGAGVDFGRVELPPHTVLFKGRSDELRSIAQVLDSSIRTSPDRAGSRLGRRLARGRDPEVAKRGRLRAHFDHMAQIRPRRSRTSPTSMPRTSCPACMTPFKTKGAVRCPECGSSSPTERAGSPARQLPAAAPPGASLQQPTDEQPIGVSWFGRATPAPHGEHDPRRNARANAGCRSAHDHRCRCPPRSASQRTTARAPNPAAKTQRRHAGSPPARSARGKAQPVRTTAARQRLDRARPHQTSASGAAIAAIAGVAPANASASIATPASTDRGREPLTRGSRPSIAQQRRPTPSRSRSGAPRRQAGAQQRLQSGDDRRTLAPSAIAAHCAAPSALVICVVR